MAVQIFGLLKFGIFFDNDIIFLNLIVFCQNSREETSGFLNIDEGDGENDNKDDFEETLKKEVNNLDKKMNNLLSHNPWVNYLNVYLLVFPLDNKREFVSSLHQKLKGGQQV